MKVWTKNAPNSVATLLSGANLCASRFHPSHETVVAYGGAGEWADTLHHVPLPRGLLHSPFTLPTDHLIHVADFRNPAETLRQLRGHKKTVSYLEFLDDSSIVSA